LVNQTEAVGILQFALDVRAACSFEHLRAAKVILQFLIDNKFMTKFPGEMGHIRKWIDETMCYLYLKSKQSNIKPSEFVACNKAMVLLLLPEADATALLCHVGDWMDKETELVNVGASSELGKCIFGFAIEQVLGGMVQRATDICITKLFEGGKIEGPMLAKAKRVLVADLQGRPGMENLSNKREIQVKYRNVACSLKVTSLMEEVDVRVACALKSSAVACGDLVALLCEDDLVQNGVIGTKGQISADVLRACQVARESCDETLMATTSLDGASVVAHLTKKEASLRSMDPTFCIEIRFFAGMVGAAGEKILEQNVVQLLPTAKSAVSETDALSSLRRLQATDLYKFTGASSQGVVLSVCTLVQDLLEGRRPSFAMSPSPFVTRVKYSLGFFCRAVDGEGVALVGAPAVEYLTEKVLKAKDMTLASLEQPIKFSWMLPDKVAASIDGHRKTALANATATLAQVSDRTSNAKRASSSSSAAVGAKKGKVAVSELEAAMSMFQGFA
jgi:hypothetical protein